jgi:predicted DNA-binding protein (MmcQ/YjbR family)
VKPKKKTSKKRGTRADPLVEFCEGLPGATKDVKWGNDLIFSVGGRMFAGFQLPAGQPLGFKVDPLVFSSLVGRDGIVPAPYMAKHHWVSVTDRARVPVAMLEDLLAEAHRLVAEKLPKKTRRDLGLEP